MKRLLLCACAAALLLAVTVRAGVVDAARSQRSADCNFTPQCDSTGEENVPIPCDGFCDSYFFCQSGKYYIKRCPLLSNFNHVKRRCEPGFVQCDWWKPTSPGQPGSTPSVPGQTGTNNPNPGGSTNNPGGSTNNPGGSTNNPGGSTNNPGGSTSSPSTTEAPGLSDCDHEARCDATGIERKPIPCKNYCNRYYLCTEGKPTVETCPRWANFDNVTRNCEYGFKNCDWYKYYRSSSSTGTSTVPTAQTPSRSTGGPVTGSGAPVTNTPPPAKPTKPGQSSATTSLPNFTVSLLLIAVAMRALS